MKTLIKNTMLGLLAFAIATGASATTFLKAKSGYPNPTAKEVAWMMNSMDLVKNKMRDPSSAKFSKVHMKPFVKNGQRIYMVCGYVNGKNAFGGFAGNQRFLSAGVKQLTIIESQMAGFGRLWNQYCHSGV